MPEGIGNACFFVFVPLGREQAGYNQTDDDSDTGIDDSGNGIADVIFPWLGIHDDKVYDGTRLDGIVGSE